MIELVLAFLLVAAPGDFRVVDGDTLAFGNERIRLHGIDAPEMDTKAGRAAKAFVESILSVRGLRCMDPNNAGIASRDRYGRLVLRCELDDGTDLACLIVKSGHGVDAPRYSKGRYAGCK